MSFADKRAIVTGGAAGIGAHITQAFTKAGAEVIVIDKCTGGDISDVSFLNEFVNSIKHPINYVVNNACISHKGILSKCSFADFEQVLRVGLIAPYYLTSRLHHQGKLAANASIINIASTRARQSQPDCESYSAAKGGLIALTHAMAVSLAGIARVNAISPGWIDTADADYSPEDHAQHPAGRVGAPNDISQMVLYLCDESKSGFITGQEFVIDGGMSRLMVYHNDNGWKYDPQL